MRRMSTYQYAAVRQRKIQRAMELEARDIERAALRAAKLVGLCITCGGDCPLRGENPKCAEAA